MPLGLSVRDTALLSLSLEPEGTAAWTVVTPVLAATGEHVPPVTGTSDLTIVAPSLSADGYSTVAGTSDLAVIAPALAGIGDLPIFGSGAFVIQTAVGYSYPPPYPRPLPYLVGTGVVDVMNKVPVALTVVTPAAAASGRVAVIGTLVGLTVRTPRLAASGPVAFVADATIVFARPVLVATGAVVVTGTGTL